MLHLKVKKGTLPFWFFTAGMLIILTLPTLIKDGMFMDAVLYTSVSHNLSEGIGTFWFPQFSYRNMSGLTSFHEQPPLGFGIQACFFKIFGDGMYTERLYTALTLGIAALLIVLLWCEIYKGDRESRRNSWLPLILFIIIPQCFWNYSNNMLENTMVIFVLLSTLFSFKSLSGDRKNYIYLLLSGLFLFCATLTKGLPGLFPVTFPLIYRLTVKNISWRKTLFSTLILLAVPALMYGALMFYPESKESLSIYVLKRVIGRINTEPVVSNRLAIVGMLLVNLIPSFLLSFILLYFSKFKGHLRKIPGFNLALFFILAGLAGSLPMIATRIQRGFYLLPSFPFFAIGLSMAVCPAVNKYIANLLERKNGYTIGLTLGMITIATALIFTLSQIGKTGRNKDMLHDIYIIGKIVPKYSVISIPNNGDMWNEWDLQCYLMRYFNISIDPRDLHSFYLDNVKQHCPPPAHYKLTEHLLVYNLYTHESDGHAVN